MSDGYMNKYEVEEVYGEVIAEYIDEIVYEVYGINGHDLFVSDGLEVELIEDYVKDFMNQ